MAYEDAWPLTEAPIKEVAADARGIARAWEIDFDSVAAVAPEAVEAIVRNFGSTRVQLPHTFFERIAAYGRPPRRQYLHGDETDSVSGRYFCASCDVSLSGFFVGRKQPGSSEVERTPYKVAIWGLAITVQPKRA
jgi:hypothetical protein